MWQGNENRNAGWKTCDMKFSFMIDRSEMRVKFWLLYKEAVLNSILKTYLVRSEREKYRYF